MNGFDPSTRNALSTFDRHLIAERSVTSPVAEASLNFTTTPGPAGLRRRLNSTTAAGLGVSGFLPVATL